MKDSEDFIYHSIKEIELIEWYKYQRYIFYPKFRPLYFVMKGRNQTVDEILVAYNEYIKTAGKHIGHKIIKKPTLYKYLAELEEQNLIVKSGKRVVIGQTASKPLYSYVAENFFPAAFDLTYFDSEVGLNIIRSTNEFYQLFPEIPDSRLEDMRELFNVSFTGNVAEFGSIMKDYMEEDPSILENIDRMELRKFMVICRNLIQILNPSIYKEELSKIKREDSK
jgi:hypothetical protein